MIHPVQKTETQKKNNADDNKAESIYFSALFLVGERFMKKESYSMDEIIPVIKTVLDNGGNFTMIPKGTSMEPFIHGGKDKVVLEPLPHQIRKYQIILYQRKDGSYVMHRVVGKDHAGYIMRGDNQRINEYKITEGQMIAKVKSIIRNGKKIDAESPGQLFILVVRTLWKKINGQ